MRDDHPLRDAWVWLSASDPGLLRLTMAVRGTASVLLTTLVALGLGSLIGATPVDFAAGIVLSMMGPFLIREPTRVQRQRTLLLLAIPAFLATVAATLRHGRGLAGNAVFLLLVFGCFLLQARSSRGVGLGLIAVVTMYVGLYLRLPAATLPTQLMSVVLAVPITSFACLVLVPIRPAWVLRRAVSAVQVRAASVLRQARQPGAAKLRRSLASLNEAALAADDQLAFLSPDKRSTIRLRLVEVEVAVARLTNLLGEASPSHSVRGLLLHERRLRYGRWSQRHSAARTDLSSSAAGSGLGAALDDLARAAALLGIETADVTPTPALAQAPSPPGPLAWRVAIRVTLASALAMAGGMALSNDRWFWAVISTYVVFLGGRSRGDTLVKGTERLGGTILGLVAGLLLAAAVGGHPELEIATLLLALFGMYYLFLLSYTLGIFCVTVLLAQLYSLLGSSLEPLLMLRMEETAIGSAAAMLVAVLVLPARTRDQVTRSGRSVLEGLAEVVRCSRQSWIGPSTPSPLEAMRKLDRQVADLRLALVPLMVGRGLLRRSSAERPVPALLECVHWARVLAAASEHGRGLCRADAAIRAEQIERRLEMLADAGPVAAPEPAELALTADACTTLGRLEQAVAVLAERLAVRRAAGFALET